MAIPSQSEAVTHREFLKYQVALEKAVDKLHKDTDIALNKIISRNVNMQGTIDKYKIKKIVDVYMTKELRKYRRDLSSQIKVGVSDSTHIGIKSILGAIAPDRKITAIIWKNTARSIRKKIISKRGIDGLKLSERVWNLNSNNMHQLKKIVSSGILQGKSAASISRDIRGYLLRPETLRGRARDLLRPGTGVYRSAYKNAMRVTRTETANAYLYGQIETAKKMGANLEWRLSFVHDKTGCECEDYNGNIYTPENYPERPHPHCLCYARTVPA